MIDNTVVVSTPPHVKSARTTRSIMLDVIIALLPCAVMGIVFFGWRAVMLELVTVASCVATEFVYFFIANKGFGSKCKNAGKVCLKWVKQFDCTSIVTGLILALILPSYVHWYEALIGAIFAIAIVKMFFGGTGKNLVNPAAAARVFMLLSFGATMVKYVAPSIDPVQLESELYTGATNLAGLLPNAVPGAGYHAAAPVSFLTSLDLFLGTGVAGCIGETSAAAILVGYIYLCARKVIKWWQPLLMLAVLGFAQVLFTGIRYGEYDMAFFLPSVLSGGAAFGAVSMFTDYVTSPKGVWGQLVYYVAGALLIAALRVLTMVEVVSYVILIMNLLVPLIDKFIRRRPFGYVKPEKGGKTK